MTGMLNTDAMTSTECPRCYQPAGKVCCDHKGKRLAVQHKERIAAYLEQHPERRKLYEEVNQGSHRSGS